MILNKRLTQKCGTDCHLAQNQDYSDTGMVVLLSHHVQIIIVKVLKTDEAAHLCQPSSLVV